jgi:hypothetical protein
LVKKLNDLIENKSKLQEYMSITEPERPEFKIPPVTGYRRTKVLHYANRITAILDGRDLVSEMKMLSYAEARRFFRHIGRTLREMGVLLENDDVFYMRFGEIVDCMGLGDEDGEFILAIRRIIESRKTEYAKFKDLPVNSKVVFAAKVFNKKVDNAYYDNSQNEEEFEDNVLGALGILAGGEEDTDGIQPEIEEENGENPQKEEIFEEQPKNPEYVEEIIENAIIPPPAPVNEPEMPVDTPKPADNSEVLKEILEEFPPKNVEEKPIEPPVAEKEIPVKQEEKKPLPKNQTEVKDAVLESLLQEKTALTPEEEESRKIMEEVKKAFAEKKAKGNAEKPKVELTKMSLEEIRNRF